VEHTYVVFNIDMIDRRATNTGAPYLSGNDRWPRTPLAALTRPRQVRLRCALPTVRPWRVVHPLRHTRGTEMTVQHAPLHVVQKALGHIDPRSTP